MEGERPALERPESIDTAGRMVFILGEERALENDLTAQAAPVALACPCIQALPYMPDPEVYDKKPFYFVVKEHSTTAECVPFLHKDVYYRRFRE